MWRPGGIAPPIFLFDLSDMTCGEPIYMNAAELTLLADNPRTISKTDFKRLVDSIKTNGFWRHRPLAVVERDGKLVVLAGNQRLKAARKLKLERVPVVVYSDLTREEEQELILRDNINNGDWDYNALQVDDFWQDVDFGFLGLEIPDTEEKAVRKKAEAKEETKPEEDDKVQEDLFANMLEDRIYDSDNEFDIPSLRLDGQPRSGLLLPFSGWGADSRAKKGIQTYHFYVEDYRFAHIWKNPASVLAGGCSELVEPNLSLFDTTPIAYGLQQIYMKRWIARFWQECGAKVYADLNVARKFYKYNRLGIPQGYNAFATRGYADRLEYLKQEIQTAREISGLDKPNMIVYGGGEAVREVCLQHNVLYVEQFMTNRGRIIKGQGDG